MSWLAQFILMFGLLVTTIAIFVPFTPGMLPTSGLEGSWVMGLQQAIVQDLSFGREIIFTYGPYSPIYTGLYHPETDSFFAFVGLYLAVSYWACLTFVLRNAQWYWILAFFIILTRLPYQREILFLLFPLLAGLLVLNMRFSANKNLAKNKLALLAVALSFSTFGLLVLIKGTLLIICVMVIILCTILLTSKEYKIITMLCLLSPIISLLFFWIIASQSIVDLPSYFVSLAHMTSGYTEAMALNGKIFEIIMYLTASSFVLVMILLQTQLIGKAKLFLSCIYFIFLFLSFKASFVRHDTHALIAAISILSAALLLPFAFTSRALLPVAVLALLTSIYIEQNYITNSLNRATKQIISTYSSALYGIQNRIENKKWPKSVFDAAMNTLRVQTTLPVFQGTTDIYSFNQSSLIASGNIWSPRPIFQSYAVYTPWLAHRNRVHLLGDEAPDNIIFRIEPIDGRLPTLEDGSSWPILLLNYQLIQRKHDFLFLQKRADIPYVGEPLILSVGQYDFGQHVQLPRFSKNPIYAQIEIQPTILGHLASLLFKTSQLKITLNLRNGITKQYRLISNMAKSGFLVSPLIDKTDDFGMLYGNKKLLLGDKNVVSLVITAHNAGSILWKDKYTITLSQIPIGPEMDISEVYKLETFDNVLLGALAEKCEGVIDTINDISPVSTTLSVSNYLQVQGWLVESVDKGVLAESTYIVLTDGQNKHRFVRTHVMPRPDVGASFKNPELSRAGYSINVDISAMKEGNYILGLAIKQSGEIRRCPQFNAPITITSQN